VGGRLAEDPCRTDFVRCRDRPGRHLRQVESEFFTFGDTRWPPTTNAVTFVATNAMTPTPRCWRRTDQLGRELTRIAVQQPPHCPFTPFQPVPVRGRFGQQAERQEPTAR